MCPFNSPLIKFPISSKLLVNKLNPNNNNNLKLGDTITVTLLDGSKRSYKVTDKFTTSPSDVSYLKEEADGSPKVILQSCTDDERSRIIIIAK